LLENHTEIISNKAVFDLLQNEEFYLKCCQMASILKPVKELTNILEARNANLAECFIGLTRLAISINRLELQQNALNKIYETASLIWYNFKYTEASCLSLLSEMRSWKRKEPQYDLSYNQSKETPLKWWMSVNVDQIEDSEIEDDNNNDSQQMLTNNLNLSQIVDLTLPKFLSTNITLFESAINRLSSHERAYNLERREYNPIQLAQQMINEENNL
ncbi:9139_t:CDS:2, partial [Racocetra fulgida]